MLPADGELAGGSTPSDPGSATAVPGTQHSAATASAATPDDAAGRALAQRLLTAWRGEVEARTVYELIAGRERDPDRAGILRKLATAEAGHRERLEARMRELGVPIPDPAGVKLSWWLRLQARVAPVDRLLRAREAAEDEEVGGVYGRPTGDPETDRLLKAIRLDEGSHSLAVGDMLGRDSLNPVAELPPRSGDDEPTAAAPIPPAPRTPPGPAGPQARLDRILGREHWHSGSGGWIGGAIYGANDGLAAVFGIVAGVSGATGGSSGFVLTAGLSGAIASALSMATGAFLAERSQMEVAVANLAMERQEIAQHPDEEREELSLFYQLKGLDRESADTLVAKLAEQPEAMLAALAAEELGTTRADGNPTQAALAGGLSTAAGAIVPVIPFFFLAGTAGIIAAAVVSLAAHFLVGAGKSLVTLRSWWAAGLEMTLAGVIVGGALYAVGLVLPFSS